MPRTADSRSTISSSAMIRAAAPKLGGLMTLIMP